MLIQQQPKAMRQPIITNRNLIFQAFLPVLPPSVNGSYKIVKVPKKRPAGAPRRAVPEMVQRLGASEALEQFKAEAAWRLKSREHYRNAHLLNILRSMKEAEVKIPLEVVIHFYYETRWLHDVDGGIKAVTDAIFKELLLNDNTVIHDDVWKFADHENPRCEIAVYLLTEE